MTFRQSKHLFLWTSLSLRTAIATTVGRTFENTTCFLNSSLRVQYKTEVVRIEVTPSLAWGYSRMNRAYIARKDDSPDVRTIYVLPKSEGTWKIAVLNWSVRWTE
jgi:hypothetical protein